MDTENRSQPEPASTDPPEKPSHPVPGREPPRLGIVHLLVWTACVALYLGLNRMIADIVSKHVALFPFPPTGVQDILTGTLLGVGSGTALAGLLLFAWRPSRGFRFPTHPGEYLWVLTGFGVAIQLLSTMLTVIGIVFERALPQFTEWVLIPFVLFSAGAQVLIWAWVIWGVKQRRWRNFFAVLIVSNVLSFAAVYFSTPLVPRHALIANMMLRLAVDAVLVVVLLQDLLESNRYPWTHWGGVATRLWFTAVSVASALPHVLAR